MSAGRSALVRTKDSATPSFRTGNGAWRSWQPCPNVVVKLGGLTMPMCGFGWHTHDTPPTSVQLAQALGPYYLFCIEQFGVERCMFESNFPVDKTSCSYVVLWNAFKRITQDFSADERLALFHDTAARAYRLKTHDALAA